MPIVLRTITLSLALAALWPIATEGRAHAEPPSADASVVEATRAHHRRGLELFDAGDFKLALVEFERAYEASRSAKVLYNIGQVHLQLRSFAEAENALTRYLVEGEPSAERVATVTTDLVAIRQRTARVTVVVNVPGARVRANDRLLGTTPLADRQLVDAGRVKITVARDGYLPNEQFIILSGREEGRLAVTLSPAGGPESAPGAAPRATPSFVPATVGWIATGVLVGSAVATGLVALAAQREAEDLRGATVDGNPESAKARLDDARSRSETFGVVTDVLGAVALVSAGLSLYLTLRPPTRDASLDMRMRPHGYGVALEGRFR